MLNSISGPRDALAKLALALFSYALLALCAGCQEQGTPVAKQTQPSQKEQVMSEKLRQDYVERKKTTKDWLRAKDAWLADLRRRYQGIDGMLKFPDDREHGRRFGELMREWNPIFCSTKDLKSIAGPPIKETANMLEYQFGAGRGSVQTWRFTIGGNTIFGVETFPLE
ncbi:MAG: hypothetical protein IH945_08840 [Armatimonadetes bacterium]|nr:hypothetical protein [Armatimonadota bacterium]